MRATPPSPLAKPASPPEYRSPPPPAGQVAHPGGSETLGRGLPAVTCCGGAGGAGPAGYIAWWPEPGFERRAGLAGAWCLRCGRLVGARPLSVRRTGPVPLRGSRLEDWAVVPEPARLAASGRFPGPGCEEAVSWACAFHPCFLLFFFFSSLFC